MHWPLIWPFSRPLAQMQELFDAIVVNPYDEDAVADAIAAAWLTFTHVHSASQSPFTQSPRDIQLFFPPGSMQSFLPSRLVWSSLAATAWARTTSEGLMFAALCTLPTLQWIQYWMFTGPEVGGYRANAPSCAAKWCSGLSWLLQQCAMGGHWWVENSSSSDSMGFGRLV